LILRARSDGLFSAIMVARKRFVSLLANTGEVWHWLLEDER
jgi:hypothetical protein